MIFPALRRMARHKINFMLSSPIYVNKLVSYSGSKGLLNFRTHQRKNIQSIRKSSETDKYSITEIIFVAKLH